MPAVDNENTLRLRRRLLALNITSSAVSRIVSLLCSLIVPRLMLEHYGSEYNGVVSAAVEFMNYATILTIGIAGPTRVALYNSLADFDEEKTSGILKATDIYMKKFSLFLVAYALAVMFFLPRLAHTTLSHRDCSLLVAIVAFSMFIEYFFTTANYTLLRSDQREYVSDVASVITTVVSSVVAVILLALERDIFCVKFCSALVYILKPLIIGCYIRKHYSINKKAVPDTSALRDRSSAAASSVANIVHDNIDLVLLSLFVDIKLVSVYTVYNLIIKGLKSVMQIFTGSLEAGFGNIIARGEKKELKQSFSIYEFLIYAFVSVVYSCVFVLIVPFVRNYTRGITDIDYIIPSFAFLMALNGATFSIRQPYMTLVHAAGRYRETKNGAIIEASLNLVLSLVLLRLIGFEGVVIGTIAANIFRSVQYCIYAYRNIIEEKISLAVKKVLWCMFNIAVICATAEPVVGKMEADGGWRIWIVQGIVTFSASLLVTVLTSVILFREETKRVENLLRRIGCRRERSE